MPRGSVILRSFQIAVWLFIGSLLLSSPCPVFCPAACCTPSNSAAIMLCHQHCQENVRLVNKCPHHELQLLNPKLDLAEQTHCLANVFLTRNILHQPCALHIHRDFLSNPPPIPIAFLNATPLRI